MNNRPLRVMWLLNHGTARKFEVPMLKRIGAQEIFLPKIVPVDPTFRSGSVDWSEDENLTIPKEDLAVLNATDWYRNPGAEAWRIADKHFDVVFFILLDLDFLKSMSLHFHGAKVWRTYGLAVPETYGRVLSYLEYRKGPSWSVDTARNFWFGQGYSHLADMEPSWIAERAVFLPAGLSDTEIHDEWTGADKRIFFVCPDIAFNSYYQKVYRDFKRTFSDVPHVVAGTQPVAVQDDHVLGYVSHEQHQRNMREFAVMYYHSTEPNHVHYHPFEAVRAGMPLVFLAGGLLDQFGGKELPGRCKDAEEARRKIGRILEGDRDLIERIRATQERLLVPMTVAHCEPIWRAGFQAILDRLEESRAPRAPSGEKNKKIAIILPAAYRGGSLRGAKLLAGALLTGSREHGVDVEIVFGHLDDQAAYAPDEFDDLPREIERRPYKWRTLSLAEATRACAYAGQKGALSGSAYIAPDDGMNQFLDCDLWIVVSDRLSSPLLPIRPYLLMVYDYLQRYERFMDDGFNQQLIGRAHAAEAIMVTTQSTAADAIQFAGLPARKVKKLPMLAPNFASDVRPALRPSQFTYFIWTTNLAVHKNHENALAALRSYYEKYAGTLECHVTGVDTRLLLKGDAPHLKALQDIRASSRAVKNHLRIRGELPDHAFRNELHGAAFLWHPGRRDNGSFSVIEAASLGVPALSSDYPAMREIDDRFKLNLTWADWDRPDDMAQKLKYMETNLTALCGRLPSTEVLADQSADRVAGQYWQAIEEFL